MSWSQVAPAVLAGLAVAAWCAPTPSRPSAQPVISGAPQPDWIGRGRRFWPAVCLLAGWLVWPGWGGALLGAGAAITVHRMVAGSEPATRRRERAEVRADLPLLILFLATSLRAGAATSSAIRQAAAALPGAAADRLVGAADRLALGVAPARVWAALVADPELCVVGRTLGRAERTGAPVAAVVERLADDLADAGRAEIEDRARAVGVRAAVPLGVCLLPSFLLLGIVPLVASLVSGLRL